MKAPIIVAALVTVAGLSGCAGSSARHSTATTTAPTNGETNGATTPTLDAAPTTVPADGCRPVEGNPCPGDRRDAPDGTVSDPPDPSAGATTTTTTGGGGPVRCSTSRQVVEGEEALIALATEQLDKVRADPNLPAEAKRILVGRYQQMLDDARSLRDSYARRAGDDGCRG
jgi:hypothetical protein